MRTRAKMLESWLCVSAVMMISWDLEACVGAAMVEERRA